MTGIKFKQKYPFGLRTVSIKRRLMIVVVVVILLLVFAFHIMFSTIVSSYMSYVELSNTRLVNSMSEAFASGINSLVAVTKYPVIRVSSLPTKTYEYLSYPNYYKANVLYSDLEYHSAFLFDQNRSIRLISIFDMFGNGSYVKHDRKQTYILAPNHREYKSEDLIKATWFEKTLEKKGRHRVWRYEDLSLPRIYLPDATEMIFVSRAIMSTEKFEPIGVALAGVDIGDLEPLFESSKILPRQIMSLYDTSGRQLWGEGSPEGGEAFLSWLKAQPEIGDVGNFIATVENHKKIYNYSRVVDDIYCVLETPYEDVLTTVLRSKFNVLCAIFIVGALITMAINFIVRSITLPIRGLIASCDDVKRGNFSVAVYDPFKDELSALSDSFNSMTREIEYLISDVYEKQM
ncbi:MAG: HAMP domain-containing protein, partial [Angelakisella sp.]